MKTVILAGLDNRVFSAADLLNPKEVKLIGFATTMESAWNIYDKDGAVKEPDDVLPIMPVDAVVGLEPDRVILASGTADENESLSYLIFRADYRGEVVSLFDVFNSFSLKTSAIRKMVWRLNSLGVEGAVADLGAYRGDISWQLNALMPQRRLYLFDTFKGYDIRDIKVEQEQNLSDAKIGDYSFSPSEYERLEEQILSRMPYPEQLIIKSGWFPETAFDLEEETYALVHMDTGLYNPTYSGIQYFFSRLSRGGVIFVSGYESGKSEGVRKAIADLEDKYGAFLITPVNDLDGTVMITHP